jgi:hypothetical protein
MNIIESRNDFNTFIIPLSKTEPFFKFNRLRKKETKLTTPSIICYVKTDEDKANITFVKTVVKCYISLNPSEDIKKDNLTFDSFDEIFIFHNIEHETLELNKVLSENQLAIFKKQVEKIKDFFEIQV